MIFNFLKGLLFGSLAGGIGGLLTAPKKGSETREQIITFLDETTEATTELTQSVERFRTAALETQKTIEETIPTVKISLKKDIEAFKFQAAPRLTRITDQTKQLQEHITIIQAKSDENTTKNSGN